MKKKAPALYRHWITHLLLCCGLLIPASLMSQASALAVAVQDTSHLSAADSLAQVFIPGMGMLTSRTDSGSSLKSTQFISRDALTITGLLSHYSSFYFRELGSPGQTTEAVIHGADARSISILLDGRPLNDPVDGRALLEKIPLEFIDEVELLSGALSSSWAGSGIGSAMNLVSHQYNTPRPVTKFKFHQASYDHLLTDVLFSQNVARGLNAMVGIQRQVTDGRFPNSHYDSWNTRTRLRYNPSTRLNLWFSDLYHKQSTALNHGINRTSSPTLYDELSAVIINRNASAASTERDLTVNALARAFSDSSWITRGVFYYSMKEREYLDPFSSMQNSSTSSYWGGQVEQQLKFPFAHTALSVELQERKVSESTIMTPVRETYTSFRGTVAIFPEGDHSLHAFGRLEHLRSESHFSWGGELRSQIAEPFTVAAGYSKAFRLPTMIEQYCSDPLLIRSHSPVPELHSAFTVKLDWAVTPEAHASLEAFSRTITDAFLYQAIPRDSLPWSLLIKSVDRLHHQGMELGLRIHLWKFTMIVIGSSLFTQQDNSEVTLVPKYRLNGELTLREQIFDGALDGTLGIRWLAMSKHQASLYLPYFNTYAALPSLRMNQMNTVDLFLTAKLGDAYLTLVVDNPFDINYMVTPYYPMPGRTIRFGVNWKFLD